ncbi:MAG: hypothetical protein F6K39_48845 [Okeania sp. SIO3B3]|nr:hypothetical protein [Okeania sp. SIO3B3]
MKDLILTTDAQVIYLPIFPTPVPATVTVRPGKLKGTGVYKVQGKTICVDGDHTQSGYVPYCAYFTPTHSVAGMGILRIGMLNPDNLSGMWVINNKQVMVTGTTLAAWFEVTLPAQTPPPSSTPDPNLFYRDGKCNFISVQQIVKDKGTSNKHHQYPPPKQDPAGQIGRFPR